MSAFPPHDPSAGRSPRPSTDPSTPAGAPSGHGMPPWNQMPDYHAQPLQPLQSRFSRYGNFSPPPSFARPQPYPTPPAHSPGPPLDFLNRPQPPFPYPDSYRPPVYPMPNHFGAQNSHSAQNDGHSPFHLTQYPLPHFIPPPFNHQNQSYDESFMAPPFMAPVRSPDVPSQYPQGGDPPRSSFAYRPAGMEPSARGLDPSPSIVNGNPRDQSHTYRQRPNTRFANSAFVDDTDAGAAARPSQRRDQSSGLRASSISPPSMPHPPWGLFREESHSGPERPRGLPSDEPPQDPEYRERAMRRQRERARARNSSVEFSPPSDSSDNDATRARRYRPGFLASSRTYEPPCVSEAQIAKFKGGLKRMVRGELPESGSTACDICDKDYSTEEVTPCEEKEIAVELPCKHIFGEDCLNTWFNTCKNQKHKVTCPMCRKVLVEPPTRRPASMRYLHLMRQTAHGEGDPLTEALDASDVLSGLTEELRHVLPPHAYESFRAALAARGGSSFGASDFGPLLRQALQASGPPGPRDAA